MSVQITEAIIVMGPCQTGELASTLGKLDEDVKSIRNWMFAADQESSGLHGK